VVKKHNKKSSDYYRLHYKLKMKTLKNLNTTLIKQLAVSSYYFVWLPAIRFSPIG